MAQTTFRFSPVSFGLSEHAPRGADYAPRNIYSTGVTHDDHHLQLTVCYSTGHW
jgi:hypothetical protein